MSLAPLCFTTLHSHTAKYTLEKSQIKQKNLFTFCCSAVLFPLAWMISKMLHIDFEGKCNPLTKAGILFSVNQMLYILIAMWVYAAVPDKMLKK